jgi:hypothetical protein
MATPNLPAIPETLVKRLYKAYRLRRRADVLAESLREEILKLTPLGFLKARITSVPYGDIVLTYTKRTRVTVDWDQVLAAFCPAAIPKVEEAKILAQADKATPDWISVKKDVAVTAGLQKKKGAVA